MRAWTLQGGAISSVLAAVLALGGPTGANAKPAGFAVKVKAGTMTLAFYASTWEKIGRGSPTAGTVTSALAPAKATPTGTFTLPLRSGTLNSVSGRGTVSERGGLKIETHLVLGVFESSSSATATAPVASIGQSSRLTFTSPDFTPSSVPLFTLLSTHARVQGSRHAVTLTKLQAALTIPGAQFLGGSFKAGQRVAAVTFQARG